MAVSRILYYKTEKQNTVEREYILIQKEQELAFLGREKESGVVFHTTHLTGLAFRSRYLMSFLDLCVESHTSPRMVEELMWDYFSPGFSPKEKTDV